MDFHHRAPEKRASLQFSLYLTSFQTMQYTKRFLQGGKDWRKYYCTIQCNLCYIYIQKGFHFSELMISVKKLVYSFASSLLVVMPRSACPWRNSSSCDASLSTSIRGSMFYHPFKATLSFDVFSLAFILPCQTSTYMYGYRTQCTFAEAMG